MKVSFSLLLLLLLLLAVTAAFARATGAVDDPADPAGPIEQPRAGAEEAALEVQVVRRSHRTKRPCCNLGRPAV